MLLNTVKFHSMLISPDVYGFLHFVQLSLTGHCHGLNDEEIKDLWLQAAVDGNGVLDYKEFLVK